MVRLKAKPIRRSQQLTDPSFNVLPSKLEGVFPMMASAASSSSVLTVDLLIVAAQRGRGPGYHLIWVARAADVGSAGERREVISEPG